MTPHQVFDDLLARTARWPHEARVPEGELRVLVKAGHALLAEPAKPILDAARLVVCDHALSGLLRPVIVLLFDAIDGAVRPFA